MGSSIVFLGDQLSVPNQQALGCDNAGDFAKNLSSQRFGLYGQSPTLIVVEAHSPVTELFSKHPILLAKVVNDLQLAVVQPPGNSDQHKRERVDPSLRIQNPLSRPPSRSTEPSHLHADPVFGPYGIRCAESLLIYAIDRQYREQRSWSQPAQVQTTRSDSLWSTGMGTGRVETRNRTRDPNPAWHERKTMETNMATVATSPPRSLLRCCPKH